LTDSASDAKTYALKLLGYRGRSEKELRERLDRKGFSRDIIDRALLRLKEAGFIDDETLAADLKRQAFERRLLGYEGARSLMLRRGLSRPVVESALGYDEDVEVEKASRVLDRKTASMGNYPAEEKKRKLWNLLKRRGYSSGVIRKAMRDFNFDEED
jgi:regulatory protein